VPDEKIAILRAWIEAGAQRPRTKSGEKRPLVIRPAGSRRSPEVKTAAWPAQSVDHFVLARLEAEGIAPRPRPTRHAAAPAESRPHRLPRRRRRSTRSSRQEIGAYERAVDRLLASPHYGERQPVRGSTSRATPTPTATVSTPRARSGNTATGLNALNRDKPYDQSSSNSSRATSCPMRPRSRRSDRLQPQHADQPGGRDRSEQFRIESVLDRVSTFGTAFLASPSAARSATSQVRPDQAARILQLFAFFNNTVDDGHGKNAPGGALEFPVKWKTRTTSPRTRGGTGRPRELPQHEGQRRRGLAGALTPEQIAKLKPPVRDALKVAWGDQRWRRSASSMRP